MKRFVWSLGMAVFVCFFGGPVWAHDPEVSCEDLEIECPSAYFCQNDSTIPPGVWCTLCTHPQGFEKKICWGAPD
jgi:hypothetical protein